MTRSRTVWRLAWWPLGGWEKQWEATGYDRHGQPLWAEVPVTTTLSPKAEIHETERDAVARGERLCATYGGNYSVKRKARQS